MKPTERLVAIMGGGDWYDASVEHLVISDDVILDLEYKLYNAWYDEEYCVALRGQNRIEFMTLSQWLTKKGAKEPEESDLIEFWEE